MTFNWKAVGQKDGNTWVDYGRVVYSLDGTNWSEISDTYAGNNAWSNANIDLSVVDAKKFYIGFKWISNPSVVNTGFIVDNILINGYSGTFSWSPVTALSNSTISNPIASPLETTVYTLTLTSNGCTSTDQVTVVVEDADNVSVSPATSTICSGNSVNLTGTTSSKVISTVLHSANFNAGNDGYKLSYNNNYGNTWGRILSFDNGGETISSGGSYFMRLQSDMTGDGSSTETISNLQSPGFSTTSYSSIKVSFRHYFRQSSPSNNSKLYLDYSTNNTDWNAIQIPVSSKGEYRIGSANNFKDTTINLPASLNNLPNVYIRFRYVHSQDWSWSIDDIRVSGVSTSMSTSSYNWSPSTNMTNASTLLPTVSPTATRTYTLAVTRGGCISKKSAIIQVDDKPILPTSITLDNDPYYCIGKARTLTQNGGVLKGSSQFIWSTQPNGSSNFSINSSNSVQHIPTSNTTYYVGVSANGACPAQYLSTGVSATLPLKGDKLAENLQSSTCLVSGTNPIHFYSTVSPYGYIGSINPNGNTATLTMTSFVDNGGTMFACEMPTNERYLTAYMGRHFVITESGARTGTNSFEVTFPFVKEEFLDLVSKSNSVTTMNLNDNVNNLSDLVVTKYNGSIEDGNPHNNCIDGSSIVLFQNSSGDLALNAALPTIQNENYYAKFSTSSFSEFHIHGAKSNSALPVELKYFSVNCLEDSKGIALNWSTSTEFNSAYFAIERSTDLNQWHEVQQLIATGNSSSDKFYQVIDSRLMSEHTYYRLKQVDLDGLEKIYDPISVACFESENSLEVYPNPANQSFYVRVNSNAETSQLFIYDVSGRIVKSQQIDKNEGQTQVYFETQDFSNGTYLIQLIQDDIKSNTKKLLIVQ